MLTFRADVFSWIPQSDVPNPIHSLPGGVARWGTGACGPRFGGDDFITPPNSYAGWNGRTYRAMQTLAFKIAKFGVRPDIVVDTGVVPGLTTVLTGPRSSGGKICTSLTPTVTNSSSDIGWNESENWYELRMHGSAHDPIPEAALKHFAGAIASDVGSALTPDLEWNITIRIQTERDVKSRLVRLRYSIADLMSLDDSGAISAPQNFGGNANLIHGLAYVRRFPSYVVYVTVSSETRTMVSLPVYFSDASARSLAEIVIGQNDAIRQLPW